MNTWCIYITLPEASEQWRVKRGLGVYKEQKEIVDKRQIKINNNLGKEKIKSVKEDPFLM